jgi:hypothetical protein
MKKQLSVMEKLSSKELMAVYGVSFASANADGNMEKEELLAIYETMDVNKLSDSERAIVHGYIIHPPKLEDCLKQLASVADEVKYAVAVNVIEVLLADDVITKKEEAVQFALKNELGVSFKQQEAIIEFVKVARKVMRDGLDNNAAEKALKSAAGGLAAVGIPIAAVYFSGSVIGLSAAGITSGLAAVGLGLGMVPGIGVAVLIGTGVFLGVKYLLGDSKETKEKQRTLEKERKAQLVIKNLQEAINVIIERIAGLDESVGKLEEDRQALMLLKERLQRLTLILKQKQAARAKV